MVRERSSRDDGRPHRCGISCLGPLSFHIHAVGDAVELSHGGQVATKTAQTFRKGLVFSSRPLKIHERLRLRVEKQEGNWHGALRVGFTTVSPWARTLPLPDMAIPDLCRSRGHWAVPIVETLCATGSVLEFWVSYGGSIYIRCGDGQPHKVLTGVDLSKPLWALMDIYGQTKSISLLGSVRKGVFTKKSCPPQHRDDSHAPRRLANLWSKSGSLDDEDECLSLLSSSMTLGPDSQCVVCFEEEAEVTLLCGHRCLCSPCAYRVMQDFGTCPLCRHSI